MIATTSRTRGKASLQRSRAALQRDDAEIQREVAASSEPEAEEHDEPTEVTGASES